MGHFPFSIDHPMPGNILFRGNAIEGIAHESRLAGIVCQFGNLSIGGDAAGGGFGG